MSCHELNDVPSRKLGEENMAEETIYTEDDLKGLSRTLLRKAARRVLGMSNRDVTSHKTDELKEMILEKQGGGSNGKSTRKSSKAAAKAVKEETEDTQEAAEEKPARSRRTRGSSSRSTRGRRGKAKETEEAAAPEESAAGVEVDLSGVEGKIDALGETVDANDAKATEAFEALQEQLAAIQKNQFIAFEIQCEIWKSLNDDPEELDGILKEIEEEYDNQGN
jgi:hypothetical protein